MQVLVLMTAYHLIVLVVALRWEDHLWLTWRPLVVIEAVFSLVGVHEAVRVSVVARLARCFELVSSVAVLVDSRR